MRRTGVLPGGGGKTYEGEIHMSETATCSYETSTHGLIDEGNGGGGHRGRDREGEEGPLIWRIENEYLPKAPFWRKPKMAQDRTASVGAPPRFVC